MLADGGVHAVYRKVLPPQLRRLRRGALLPGRPPGRPCRARRQRRRADDLRGHLGARARRPATRRSAGATVIVNISASPYHAGKGLERERMFAQRARDTLGRASPSAPRRRPGRAGLRRALVSSSTTTARRSRARAQFERGAAGLRRRPRGGRGRRACATRGTAPARSASAQAPTVACWCCRSCRPRGAPARRAPAAADRSRALLDPLEAEVYARARARPARLRREERLRATSCSASRAASTRRWSPASPSTRSAPSASAVVDHALAATPPRARRQDARALAAALGVAAARAADRARDGRLRRDARRRVRRPRARPHRGEPPGAHPRQPADGAVEQVRLARADDRQQVARCRSATRRSTATWPAASP